MYNLYITYTEGTTPEKKRTTPEKTPEKQRSYPDKTGTKTEKT